MHKTSVIFLISPATEETNIQDVEKNIKNIKMDGLTWGEFRKEPLTGKLSRLRALAVVDNKTSVDDLEEKINNMDLVQSVDIEAMSEI
ncbi:hypothetical protein RB653_000461 [Dictyostelium firmibasis]|uniref:Translation elongation factor EF1B beta/delta subunit guanine nucleotide exchange domain-containing protein n=1 Tax=Dictyostelium firmibasis TaxID=79012 RepID=A0AAN7YQN7_9MYCE